MLSAHQRTPNKKTAGKNGMLENNASKYYNASSEIIRIGPKAVVRTPNPNWWLTWE